MVTEEPSNAKAPTLVAVSNFTTSRDGHALNALGPMVKTEGRFTTAKSGSDSNAC